MSCAAKNGLGNLKSKWGRKMEQTNFNDIVKKSFLNVEAFQQLPFLNILIGLLISFAMGMFIYYLYKKTYRGVVYSDSYNISLVLMTLITSIVIMTISTNIVLSLGMVGALSIVRFRTAVKDPGILCSCFGPFLSV